MFLEFTDGSFLWDWHHSPIGVVAMWASIMVAIVMSGSRTRTYSGRVLKFLAVDIIKLVFLQFGLQKLCGFRFSLGAGESASQVIAENFEVHLNFT